MFEGLEERRLLAIVVTGEFMAGQRSGIPVSNTDLINGLIPAPADTNYIRTFEGGPIDNLTNGRTNAPGSTDLNDFSNQQTAVFSLNPTPPHGPTWFATYRLNLGAAPAGYDITQIDSITGHQDNRTNQTIDIEVQFVGDPNFYSLSNNANFEYRPNLGSGAGRLRITDTDGLIARGVRAIRFEADQEAVYRELDVIGTPTAAPTSAPLAPSNVQATLQGSAVSLSFTDQANNESAFRIERATVVGGVAGAFERLGAVQVSDGTGGQLVFLDPSTEIGQTYRYRVTTLNSFAGGTSAAPVTVDVTTPASGPGAAARFFAAPRWQGTPLIEQLDSNLADNNFGTGSPHPSIPTDNFSAIYTATLTPPTTGAYTFDIAVDDEGLLFLSGPGLSGQQQVADLQTVDLTGGQGYQMVFLAREAGGGAAFNLSWTNPAGTVEPIPTSALNSAILPVTAAPTGVSAAPNNSNSVQVSFSDNSLNEAKFVLERALVTGGVAGAYSVVAEELPNAFVLTDNSANANTTYSYRVRALNFDGPGAVSQAVQVTTPPRTALNGANGAWFSTGFWGLPGRPSQSGLAVTANPNYREEVGTIDFPDPNLNRNGNGIPVDNFSTVFTGKIIAPENGDYFILGFGDDDTHVFVNGVLVSSDPGGHGTPGNDAAGIGSIDVRTPINLTAGQSYNFVVMQAEQGGGAGVILRWILPSDADKNNGDIIPNTNLTNIADLPSAPTAGTPDIATATSATITWADNATSELRYRVELSSDPTFATIDRTINAPINATSATFTGLTQGATYHYRIRGVNLEGEGPEFRGSVTTSATTTPPAAPTNLAARPISDRLTTLTWTDVALNEESYVISRRVGNTGNFEQVGTADPGATTFTDQIVPALPAGTQVTYQVVARNAEGDSPAVQVTTNAGGPGGTGLPATAYANTTFTDDPANPNDTVSYTDPDVGDNWSLGPPVAGIPEDNFSVLWQGQVQAEKTEAYTFQVEGDDQTGLMIVDSTGTVLVNLPLGGGLKTSAPVNLVAGQRYTVIMRHVEIGGGASAFLRWASPTTPLEVIPQVFLFAGDPNAPLQAPTITAGSAIGAEAINLAINPNFNNLTETGYQILRSPTGAAGTFTVVGTTGPDVTSFSDTQNIQLGQTYHYQVRAIRGATLGPVSQTFIVGPVAIGGTEVTTNGSATVLPGPDNNPATTADNQLQLTPNDDGQTGSAFTTNARTIDTAGQGPAGSAGFTTSFEFVVPAASTNPADGFAFVIQRNNPTVIGGAGGGLGATNIPNSVALEFDFYDNQNEIGVYLNGSNQIADDAAGNSADSGFQLANGNTYRATVAYNAGTNEMTVTVVNVTDPAATPFNFTFTSGRMPDGTDAPLDISQIVGGNLAFFGFTGATGGLTADQRIQNWTINGQAIPFVVPVTRKPGDADGDGDVDGVDISRWGLNFTGSLAAGTGGKTVEQGDFDGDGDVDGNDAAIWGVNFTGDLGGGGLTASAPVAAALLPAASTPSTLATPLATPVTTPTKPALLPAAKPTARPVVKPAATPVVKPAAKPALKPAARPAKPAARPAAKPAVPAGKVSPVGSLFSSTKIGAKSSVLGSKTGGVL